MNTGKGCRSKTAAVQKQRIVCLAPNMVEIVYALGLGRQIVGWSIYTDFPAEVRRRDGFRPYDFYDGLTAADFDAEEELSHEVASVSGYYDCNDEIIARLRPTVILGSEDAQQPMVDRLKASGYNAHCFSYTSLRDVFGAVIQIGDLLGVGRKARRLAAGYEADLKALATVTAPLEKIPVYFEIAHRRDCGEYGILGPFTTARGTPMEEMLELAGGVNIFHEKQGDYIQVEFAEIAARNPAVILSPIWTNAKPSEITTPDEIKARPGFDTIDAVRTDRVLYYDSSLMKRFGPRTAQAVRELARLLHPEAFRDPAGS